jgi:hypothetical protein
MLELIMVLSAVLHKFPDLSAVSALLIVNALLSFAQERRAAGVVETLRKREFLQCCRLGGSVLRRPPGWKIDKRAPTESPKITGMTSPDSDCA